MTVITIVNNCNHNTDGQTHPHVIWTNELTLQFTSLTQHTPTQVTLSRFELGRDVVKVLNGTLLRGHIECIDSDDDDGGLLRTVVYEDGNKEDLDPQECEEVVTLSDDVTI